MTELRLISVFDIFSLFFFRSRECIDGMFVFHILSDKKDNYTQLRIDVIRDVERKISDDLVN